MSVLDLLEFGRRRRVPIIRQAEASECGIACLAMIAAYHGLDVGMPIFRRRFGVGARGVTLRRVMDIAEQIGLSGRALRIEIDEIKSVSLPAMLHWDLNHFVVLSGMKMTRNGPTFVILDPARGERTISSTEFSRLFTGVILELSKAPSFRPHVINSRLRIRQLWSGLHGAGRALWTVLALSAVLQLISLVSPLYLQLSLDSVLPASDHHLLATLALGFGGLVVLDTLAVLLRGIAILNLTSAFTFQIINNLYRHLVCLPLAWFEKRHVGDIVSRFGSIQPVTELLSQGMVTAFLDGVMALITLLFMYIYSPELASLALIVLVLYCVLRLTSFGVMRQSNTGSIAANARESSMFMETVRGISTLKAFGQEVPRQRMWQSLKANAINAQLKLGRITIGFDAFSGLVIGVERVFFVYLAVGLAMDGRLSIGMIFAFQAYKSQFLDAGARLVDQALKYRLIEVHMTRIADIALSKPEIAGPYFNDVASIRGPIELRNVSFRYGIGEPFVLRNANIFVNPGEMVVLVGPSGSGKTTILKLLMGLLEPTAGEVLIDGHPLSQIGLTNWRSGISSVLQDDRLFAGTLAENVAFFDQSVDLQKVRKACTQARVLGEIEAMPLGLESLVGDMGSSLSGGQRQRVMFARALYADSPVMFIDEGTANLDPETESAILTTLCSLTNTRIISAHRPNAVAAASRAYLVQGARISEIDRHVGVLEEFSIYPKSVIL